ncbi:MAG: phytanoyl-CoA dioxygenase family protein [Myxococcales bacterium]|nr:phytanoyl-CoA dioxygenase family protein [Myxococcales bacterium]
MKASPEQRREWHRNGFFVIERYAGRPVLASMLERAVEISRESGGAGTLGSALIVPEQALVARATTPEEAVSKVFRVHRDESVFHAFCTEAGLVELIEDLLDSELECFLSQFIFKRPGALGQPWHQDEFYFPFDRGPQAGVWLAVTEARLDNGPLWVLPGSHAGPVHPAVRDRREHANQAYVEIVDLDFSGEVPVLLQPGDLLIFHGRLMHRSTDNRSGDMRAAMVYHYTERGTRDHTRERFGFESPNTDFMPVSSRGPLAAS